MPVLRFHLIDLYYSQVEGGFLVTCTTNAACHLYLRYSDNFPFIHRKPVTRRGLVMGWDARYCFTAYHHIEQNEPGDEWTHTFTWPGWKDCERRYFYFWGTMGGQDMVSDTPIFWLHYLVTVGPPPVQTIFYPDPHPELTCMDGRTHVDTTWTTWPLIHAMAATSCGTDATFAHIYLRCGTGTPGNCYYQLYRHIILLDMSVNIGCFISSAKLHIWGREKQDNANKLPALAVYSSNPVSNTSLVLADHKTLGDTDFTDWVNYIDFVINGWNVFTFNSAGLAFLNAALAADGIVKLGIREARYDAANIGPFPDVTNRIIVFSWETVDYGLDHKPFLEVA